LGGGGRRPVGGRSARPTGRQPTHLGDHVLVGPHAAITGAVIEDEVFVATGAMVFNGAVLERTSSVALRAAVHIGCRLPAGTRVPIGWVAVGDPAVLHPPEEVDAIRAGIEDAGGFIPYVFGTDPGLDRGEAMERALGRYSRALASHATDRLLGDE
jgi:hypothetical protein